MGATKSFTDTAEAIFRQHPSTWLSWTVFFDACGHLAWRTRISECRKRGMTITNRLMHDPTGQTHSYYRYQPEGDHAGL